jgi:hypothetical protein
MGRAFLALLITAGPLVAVLAWGTLDGPWRWVPAGVCVFGFGVLALTAARTSPLRVTVRSVVTTATHVELGLEVSCSRAVHAKTLAVFLSGWTAVESGGVWGPAEVARSERVSLPIDRRFSRGDGWVGEVRVPLERRAGEVSWRVDVEVVTREGQTLLGQAPLARDP